MNKKSLGKICASDIMNPTVFGVSDELTVEELAKVFQEKKISGAPVIDADGRIVGVVTASDIAMLGTKSKKTEQSKADSFYSTSSSEEGTGSFFEMDLDVDANATRVKEIMTDTIFSVDPEAPLPEIASMMVNGRIHRVFVMDADEKMLGVISALDMVKIIATSQFA